MMMHYRTALAALATTAMITIGSGAALAEEVTITVWSGGSGPNDNYRIDAIKIAADFLEREEAIRGNELNITVEGKPYTQWDEFK